MTESDKETDRFSAVDNEGERYTVVELLQRSIFRRVKRHVLLSGEKVDPLKDGTFQIFEAGKILRNSANETSVMQSNSAPRSLRHTRFQAGRQGRVHRCSKKYPQSQSERGLKVWGQKAQWCFRRCAE